MILQGLSAETLARLVTLARHGEDFSGLLSGPRPEIDSRRFPEPANDKDRPYPMAAE